MIDHVGCQHQRNFAQLGKLVLVLSLTDHRRLLDRRPANDSAVFRRGVHQFDLIGGANEGLRHGIFDLFPRIASTWSCFSWMNWRLMEVMTEIRPDSSSSTSCQRLRVLAARGIIVSQTVDEANFRMPVKHRGHVNERNSLIFLRAGSLQRR